MPPELPDLDLHPSPTIKGLKKNVVSLYNVIEIVIQTPGEIETLRSVMRAACTKILDGGDFDSFDQVIHAVGKQVTEVVNQKQRTHRSL